MKVSAIVVHRFGDPAEVAECQEIDLPHVGPNQVRVRMLFAPINPADINLIQGTYATKPELPVVPGGEGVGVVEETGDAVQDLAVGTRVLFPAGLGSWREQLVAETADLMPVPDEIPVEQAAMLRVNPATAFRMLHDFVNLEPGEWLIQNASNSGVGRAVIQIAAARGWRTVNLVRREELVQELRDLGADAVVVEGSAAGEQIAKATGGAPIRLALNAVGGESALRLAEALAPGGTHVTYGAMGRQPVRLPNGLLIFKNLCFRGFWVTRWYREASREARDAMLRELFTLAREGHLHTPVEHVFPLTECKAALRRAMEGGRGGRFCSPGRNRKPCSLAKRSSCATVRPVPALSRFSQLWRQRRFRRLLVVVLSLVVLAGITAGVVQLWNDWDAKGAIEPRGGVPFLKRVELAVPSYRQNDPQWGKDLLGPTEGTLGAEGCAVSSAAMVLSSYGIDTDPQRLNKFLNERDGYTPQGWIYWEKAAELAPDKVRHAYEDLPSYRLIDTNLLNGNPVIVRLRLPSGTTHFVVIAGKDGFDYLTRDPGAGAAKGLYPLKEFGSKIEALRFYERL